MESILIDIGAVPEDQCNNCLEDLFKALSEDPVGDPTSIWARHDNPWLADHVEDVTERFQAILQRIQDIMGKLLLGEPIGELAKASAPWLRWDATQLADVRARLEGKSPAAYSLDDWMLVADYLIQRYLPDDVINSEAEYLTVRASILGKIQAASTENKPHSDPMAGWSALVPTTFAAIPPRVLSPVELDVLYVAKTRAAIAISSVKESTRTKMKTIIIEHVQAQILGQKEGQYKALATRLFDEFGQLNRDFRRIAVTEAGECCNQGFIAAQGFGSKVQRREAYRGACEFCRSINGKTFTVIDPAASEKHGETEVWLGKTNIGRSASPRQRVGGMLMERGINQRWWPAAGVQHPHCRGSWLALPDVKPGVNLEFVSFMEATIAKARAEAAAKANVAAAARKPVQRS